MAELQGTQAWDELRQRLRGEILFNPAASALEHVGQAMRGELQAEIARLQAELDQYQGRMVLHTTDANMMAAAVVSTDEEDGTVLRATDTGREMLLSEGHWTERHLR